MAQDPVCLRYVDALKAKEKIRYQDRTYYFCSTKCREEFEKEPERYAREENARRSR
jgi:YHS domain-containing protein